jgi:hypothetical protein
VANKLASHYHGIILEGPLIQTELAAKRRALLGSTVLHLCAHTYYSDCKVQQPEQSPRKRLICAPTERALSRESLGICPRSQLYVR